METPTLLDRYMALSREADDLGGDVCGYLQTAMVARFEALALPTLDDLIVAAVEGGAKLHRST